MFILIILIFSGIVFQLFHDISPTILCTFGVKFALFPTLQKLCFEFNFQFPQADNYKVAGRDLNLILEAQIKIKLHCFSQDLTLDEILKVEQNLTD